uniref:Transposase n=1 Tax=Chilo suppressalis TaxID=168631 RepID=S4UKH5_CHISP|nr:transposase [Chilo suppressalis]
MRSFWWWLHVYAWFYVLFTAMASKACSDGQIEDILLRLEAGDISEDDCESEGDDLDFYPTREELLQVLEDDYELTNDDETGNDGDRSDPPLICDDENIHVSSSATDQRIPIRQMIWKKQSFPFDENRIKFESNTPYSSDIVNLDTPFHFFSYFFTKELLENIVQETNKYSVQKNPARPDTITVTELRQYLGILVYMSVFRYPSVRFYWNTKHAFTPISETMALNRFEKIRNILHFNDNEKHMPKDHPHHDRLHKLRPIIDHLNNKFGSIPYDQRLSIDEQMCATKLAHFMKQYLPNKPHKWGFKLFVMCSLQGFAYQFEIYSGKMIHDRLSTEPELGAVSDTVVRLTRRVPRNRNHIIYFDNFYTNIPLMHYFAQHGIYCLGTVQRNRLGKNCKLPSKAEVMKSNVPRGDFVENISSYEGTPITTVSWKDNKQVILLSTYVGADPIETIERYDKKEKKRVTIPCPRLIKEYNSHMGGVDLMDSFLGRYRIHMKTRKWYLRIFYHLLDITIINSWVLYLKINKQKGINPKNLMDLAEFRADLAEALCKYGIHKENKRGRPSSSIEEAIAKKKKNSIMPAMPPKDVRLDKVGHEPITTYTRRRCQYPQCKLLSSIKCSKCDVILCFKKKCNCFVLFHNN